MRVPFLADQPFWAALLHRRGLACAPLPARRLTAARAMAVEDGYGEALGLLGGVVR
ncbi:hypothetical protein [Quadrisphaera sp. KR29]|uniref:hypothetical protein n=1 Tax=Quadrisphaera sp. KR29 TaxID=3461391 RepID=UPI0040442C27